MFLINEIWNIFKWRKRAFITLFINSFIVILFYYLLFENSEIIYPSILSLAVIFVYFIFEGINYYRFKKKLVEAVKSPDYSFKDIDFGEKECIQEINKLHKEYLEKIYDLENRFKERDILFSHWIHNMKTSVSVIDLACEKVNLKEECCDEICDIQLENNLLKKELEEGLNIIRLEEFAKDYVTKKYNLNHLVMEVINKKKREFIYAGVFPLVEVDKTLIIYTDKKWFSYMLEQVISNGIKYSKKGDKLSFKSNLNNGKVEFSIIDTGIGIKKEEIKRVFEPFYTGSNGRENKDSTGIGLYMVKRVSQKLNHSINIESEEGRGTKVIIEI